MNNTITLKGKDRTNLEVTIFWLNKAGSTQCTEKVIFPHSMVTGKV